MTSTETRADKLAKIESALLSYGAVCVRADLATRILDALEPRVRKSVTLPSGERVEWHSAGYWEIAQREYRYGSLTRLLVHIAPNNANVSDLAAALLALRENDGYESEPARETSVVLANGWTVRWDGDAYKAVGATVRRFSSAAHCVRELIGVYGDDSTVSRLLALRGTP